MKYRRILFVLSFIFLNSVTGQNVKKIVEQITDLNENRNLDANRQRGLIEEITHALEGVVSVTEDVLDVILQPVKQLIRLNQKAVTENPHKNDIALVRIGNTINEQELAFREVRFPIVKKALEKFLDINFDDEDMLEIAFCGSGGGMRAKTSSLGFCFAADSVGLLDAVMYMAGVSGTTWFLAPWISSGLPLSKYKERALKDLCHGLDIQSLYDFEHIFDAFWVKFAFNQHVNLIDLFGALLGNNMLRAFGKEQHMIYLSEQQKIIADGAFPLPVYTAVLADRNMPNYWFECTPFEVGSRWLKAYVPSWAFGRKFKKGKSCSFAPEQSLGFMLGMFGSAFAASFEEMYNRSFQYMELPAFLTGIPGANHIFNALKKIIAKIVYQSDIGEFRVSWAQLYNYVYQMNDIPFHNHKRIRFVDAGTEFNNPIFAAYRKPPFGGAPDVIFVFDASTRVGMEQLELAQTYAREHDFMFPSLDKEDADKRALTVYQDEMNPDIPLILYMPFVIDQKLLECCAENEKLNRYIEQLKNFDLKTEVEAGFADTFTFEYTREQAEQLVSVSEFNFLAHVDEIKKMLKERIDLKRRHRLSQSCRV